ncbi:hypothetical protein Tco_1487266, partial [Tanacetum coccineum]
LKQLGFTEWIEIQALASKEVRLTPAERKRKRTSEMIKEVFVKERMDVDRAQRNLTLPSVFQRESEFHITSTVQLIILLKHINQDSPEAREMYKIMEIEIESRDDVNKAREIVRTNSDRMGIDV